MDIELLKYAATLGVGGVLAAGMFFMYRQDAKEWRDSWKGQSEMMVQVVKENTAAVTALSQIVNAALTENSAMLRERLKEKRS